MCRLDDKYLNIKHVLSSKLNYNHVCNCYNVEEMRCTDRVTEFAEQIGWKQ